MIAIRSARCGVFGQRIQNIRLEQQSQEPHKTMLKHVRITNYKSLGDVSVSLEPVTVLIGRSGTGKTNFVEALRLLRDSVRLNAAHLRDPHEFQRCLPVTASGPIELLLDVTFDAPGVEGEFQYRIGNRFEVRGPNSFVQSPPEEFLLLGKRILFHQEKGQWMEPPQVVNPPTPQGPMLGAITGIPEISTAHLVLSAGIGCYSFPDTILTQPSMGGQTLTNGTVQENGLSDRGDNFLQAFNAITTNLQAWHHRKDLIAGLRCLNPSDRCR